MFFNRTFFLVLSFFLSLSVNYLAEDCYSQDFISYNSDFNDRQYSYSPVIMLSPDNKLYQVIQGEVDVINKSYKNSSDEVKLDDVRSIACNSFKIINSIVGKYVNMAGVRMPEIFLYLGQDGSAYNASVQTFTITYSKRVNIVRNNKIVGHDFNSNIEKRYKLVIGAEAFKLLMWCSCGEKLLAAIICHEIGHMCDTEKRNPKYAEYFADTKAVCLLGKSDSKYLVQGVNMITLARHIFNILTLNSEILRLNIQDVYQVIRIITNSIVSEFYDLGDLGRCSTHKKFGYIVNKVFQDSLKYSLDPNIGMTEKEFVNVYNRLCKSCKNMSDYIGLSEDFKISHEYEFIERYTNQIYNHITHPAPLERLLNIEKSIKTLI